MYLTRTNMQELFEAVFNYFPITFRPPPDDPYGISAQQLKNRLCECIAANGAFAPFAFPALLDKLDSTALNTKVNQCSEYWNSANVLSQRDVLGVILACILAYGSLTVSAYAITLWDALKYEVFNAQEDDLAEGALAILKSIATKLSDRRDGLLDSYVLPLAKECNRHFEDTPTKQSQAAAQIVCKVAEASHRTFDLIFRAVVPNIISMYHSSEAIARRRGLLEVLVKLHRSAIEIYGTWTEKPSMSEHVDSTNAGSAENGNALLDFREQLLNIMISVLAGMRTNEVSLCLTCVDGLLQMARLRCFLSVAELTRVMQLMSTVLISEEDSRQSEVKAATLDALVEMAHQKPQTCIDVVIPELMAKLPDTDQDDSASRVPVLEAFAKLGTEEKLFSTVIVRLRGKLFAALQHQASTKYIFAIVSALLYTFTEQVSRPTNHIDYGPYYDSIVKPFMSHVADATRSDHPAFGDDAFWDVLGRLCNVIVRPQQLERQNEVAQELGALWDKATQSQSEEPKLQSELISSRLIIMSTYLIASIRRVVNITIDVGKHVQLLARLAAGSAMSREADTAVLWQISLLLNKFASPSDVEKILMDYMGTAFAPETRSESSIRVVFAMTKGAVLRNHPKVVNVFPSLLESLADPDWGFIIARRFSTLLEPDTMLIKENDCLISGLHRQKLYAYVVPAVIESFREAAPATKKNHLIALSGILRWLPYSVIEADLPALIPLLLQSLDLDDEHGVRSATIDCLTTVLLQNPKAVQEHVGSLISRLLTTATTPDTPAKLRATALQCLTLVPGHFRGDIVLPYKRQVVKRLVSALDDRKRAVRMEAVKCTARWVDMDEVDDDE